MYSKIGNVSKFESLIQTGNEKKVSVKDNMSQLYVTVTISLLSTI